MLIEQRCGAPHAHWRQRKAHGRAWRLVFTYDRMIDLLQPLAHAVLLAIDQLADGIERRRRKMARLRFVGEIIGVELADKVGEGLGDLFGVLVAISRIFPLRTGE